MSPLKKLLLKIAPLALALAFTAAPLAHTPAAAQNAADAAATPAPAATLRITVQDRLPFKKQLQEEVAKLNAEADALAPKAAPAAPAAKSPAAAAPKSKKSSAKSAKQSPAAKEAAAARGEAERLATKEIPSITEGGTSVRQTVHQWNPAETAIVICDMWDQHWCKHATARVGELAPALNEVLTIAREKGVTIVHAPSDCLGFYKDHPARKKAEKYKTGQKDKWASNLPSEKGAKWPIKQIDACPECKNGKKWTRQIEALTIKDDDLISDSGVEVRGYFKEKGIKNVILTGVHTNMCVIGRPFGLRAMKAAGYNTVLMRDMTDLIYNNVVGNNQYAPHVDHFSGLDLIIGYIETYVTPSILSSDFTGKKQFRFKEDTRPRVAFLSAESEYRSSQRLQEFGNELIRRNIHPEYALGRPIMNGPGRHNIENLQILDDADLAVFFIRRRALEPEKMAQIKAYVASGRPVLGIRTASHAFDSKGNVPREGGAIVAAKEKASGNLAQWTSFDKDVLGGNYKGHYGHLKTGTDFSIVEAQKDHPILKGVDANFNTLNWLYQNTPLRTPKATVLLEGRNPGKPAEPVLWLNEAGKGKVIYTSLGYWDDWKLPAVKKLLHNSVDFLLATGEAK